MKAIILAAGLGSRLLPMTDKIPKTLVEVNGKPMLSYILDALVENEINDIVIVVGYKAEQIIDFCLKNYPQLNFEFILNNAYERTNTSYSLYLARAHFGETILLMNGDVILRKDIINMLISSESSAIAVDFCDKLNTPRIKVHENCLTCLSHKINASDADGSSPDIFKIIPEDLKAIECMLINSIEYKNDLLKMKSDILICS